MGKIIVVSARKEWKCSKCGKAISKGEQYYLLSRNYHGVQRRCIDCGFRNWEKSSSVYIRTIGQLQDSVTAMVNRNNVDMPFIMNTLDWLAEGMEISYDNLPDGINESPMGLTLQERIDKLQEAITQLEEMEDSEDELDYKKLQHIIGRL